MHEKNLNISILYDFYGEMLRGNQKKAIEMYYNDDLSLSEIALELGITRQGVRDALKRGEEALNRMEDSLLLAKRFQTAGKQLDEISQQLKVLKESLPANEQVKIDSITASLEHIDL